MQLDIIYEDERLLVCNKPAGVLAQGSRSFDVDMVSALMAYRRKKGEDTYIGVINRLDRPVSGLMVFAKSSEEAARLNRMMQADTFNKTYIALVAGEMKDTHGIMEDWLVKDTGSNVSVIADKGVSQAKLARLEYEVLEVKELPVRQHLQSDSDDISVQRVTMVKIHLITGRHHQIRVQLAGRGYAILGDMKYSDGIVARDIMESLMHQYGIRRNTIALCACSLDIGGRHFETDAYWNKSYEQSEL